MLTLNQAFDLYHILMPHLPKDVPEDMMMITYAKHILVSMEGKDGDAYTRAMMILTGLSRQELVGLPVKELLDTFMMKLSENHILELQKFMQEIGYV